MLGHGPGPAANLGIGVRKMSAAASSGDDEENEELEDHGDLVIAGCRTGFVLPLKAAMMMTTIGLG